MLRYQPMLAVRLRKFRRKLLDEFPTNELPAWRSEQWQQKPHVLAAELERLQQTVSDPDQLRLIAGALVDLLLLHKNTSDLWTVKRVRNLSRAELGLIAAWSGKKRHEEKKIEVDRRNALLNRDAAAEVLETGDPRITVSKIAGRLARRYGLSVDRTRKIIAKTVVSARNSLGFKEREWLTSAYTIQKRGVRNSI